MLAASKVESKLDYELTTDNSNSLRMVYFFWLLIASLANVMVYLSYKGDNAEYYSSLNTVVGLIILLGHFVYRTLSKQTNWLAPDILYLLAYFLFHYSSITLQLFGIADDVDIDYLSLERFPQVLFIVNLGLIGFVVGYELFCNRVAKRITKRIPGNGWGVFGIVLMVVALIIHIVYMLIVGIDTFVREGYTVSSKMHYFVEEARFWRLHFHLFTMGFAVYIIAVALKHGRIFKGRLGISLCVLFLLLLIMEGGRSQIVTLILVLILVRHYLIKPIGFKYLVVIFLGCIFLFNSIKIVRNLTAYDVDLMKNELIYAYGQGEAHWYDSFREMGGSVRTIDMTLGLLEVQPYWYGKGYVISIVHIIPFLQGLLNDYLGPSPGQWLTYTLFGYGAAGTGFSIVGEGYLNFGYPGAFLQMFIIGWFLKWLYKSTTENLSPAKMLVFVVGLGIIMIAVRNDSNIIISPLVKVAVLAWFLNFLFGSEEITLDSVNVDEKDMLITEG